MHRCECGDVPRPNTHAHVFVDLNGHPYLLAEYMDRHSLQQVDRSAIISGITIDTSDAMRAVIDISINDIGERNDSTPNIVGNGTKTKWLLDIISRNANQLEGNLPVLKSGIIMRVNYQLEVQGRNRAPGRVIRSMVEDLRITDRKYFLDINRFNFNDNAVIVNFSNSMISTINEFTHGRDRMVLRVTNVQMFYELVSDRQPVPRIKQSLVSHPFDRPSGGNFRSGTNEEYYYQREMQNTHYIGDPPFYTENELVSPPSWAMFNQFYHFDQDGRRIILHQNEIYDPMGKTTLIPCGRANVNRTFLINPGHRLIFKFSVWKNDVTAVFDTLNVARALKAKFYDCSDHHCTHGNCQCDNDHHDHHHDHKYNHHDHGCSEHNEYSKLVSMLFEERKKNEASGKTISDLLDRIKTLEDKIAELGGEDEDVPTTPIEPIEPGDNLDDCECGCDHTEINQKLDELDQRIDEEDIDPMAPEVVEEIFKDVVNNENTGGI